VVPIGLQADYLAPVQQYCTVLLDGGSQAASCRIVLAVLRAKIALTAPAAREPLTG
jgi:hypothetical protein